MYQDFSPRAKQAIRYLSIALLVGLVLAVFSFTMNTLNTVSTGKQFSVTGEGSTSVRPDVAVFNATVITQSANIEDAQEENTKKSDATIEFLKKAGVEEKDIKTSGYNIYPQYQYFDNPTCYSESCPAPRAPQIIAYEVRHTLEIKGRDLEKVDELLSGVVASGANEIGSIQFTVDDPEALLEGVRAEAIANAKEKAESLADELGVSLKGVASFSESTNGVPAYDLARNQSGGGYGGGGPIQEGEQEITIVVNVTYNFR